MGNDDERWVGDVAAGCGASDLDDIIFGETTTVLTATSARELLGLLAQHPAPDLIEAGTRDGRVITRYFLPGDVVIVFDKGRQGG
jgi:hypothetical protein